MTSQVSTFGSLIFPALVFALLTACSDRPSQNQASENRPAPSLAKPCSPISDANGQNIVTSWKAAPSDALITHPISGLSVRQSLAPHWPGQTVRLRITNRYSSLPIVLDRVHVARERAPGSADVIPDSQCLLTFDGQSQVTLKPGETRVSDWTSYAIKPFERLSISFHAPSITPQVTRHLGANEFVYISTPGDYAADASGAAYQQTPDGYASNFLVIEALEVLSRPQIKTLVVVGDSITDGSDSTTGFIDGQGSPMTATDQRYPDHLQRRILKAGLPIAIANAGIGGNELLNDGWLPQFGPALVKRLDTDVLETAGVSHILLMIGTNDFGNPHVGAAPTSAALIAGLKAVIERAQAAGLKIVLGTIPPAEGAVWDGIPILGVTPLHVQILHGTAEARRSRDETNVWIRQQTLSDGVVDFDACLGDPDRPGYLAPLYNSGDNLHPSPLGYAAMADCVNLNLFSGA